jgi:hypothetical protein
VRKLELCAMAGKQHQQSETEPNDRWSAAAATNPLPAAPLWPRSARRADGAEAASDICLIGRYADDILAVAAE